ncbi:uncharacterized protein LOC120003790 isoform X2 [Tripterygium wilfordii]|nr:uncharacterized protein LOC120003790 isoform X2 [Tripterygium wilfordii]
MILSYLEDWFHLIQIGPCLYQPNIHVHHWWGHFWNFGIHGLIWIFFYFLIMEITSAGLVAKAKFSVYSYFDSWNRIMLDGIMGGLMKIASTCKLKATLLEVVAS